MSLDRALPAKDILTGREIATSIGVDPKTISRWADKGIIPFMRTAGGHRRYPRKGVIAALNRKNKEN